MSRSLFKALSVAVTAVVFLLCSTLPVKAQTLGNGNIVGAVTDPSGAAVPNATVVVTNTDTGVSRTLTSNGDGLYTANFLLPGHYEVIAEASDGLEGVQKAEELRPDLVLLDISLPRLNRIEVARRLLRLIPKAKILFLAEDRSRDFAAAALSMGTGGYVVKSDAARELLSAIEAVLKGELFVSGNVDRPEPLP